VRCASDSGNNSNSRFGSRLPLFEFENFAKYYLVAKQDFACSTIVDENTLKHLKSDSSSFSAAELPAIVPPLLSYLAVSQCWFYVGEISRQCKFSSVAPALARAARFGVVLFLVLVLVFFFFFPTKPFVGGDLDSCFKKRSFDKSVICVARSRHPPSRSRHQSLKKQNTFFFFFPKIQQKQSRCRVRSFRRICFK
jgi:hypothetical protein